MRVNMCDQNFHAMMEYIMNMIKKLTFAPVFLISFSILIVQFSSILKSYDFIFSLSIDALIQLVIVAALVSLSSFLFILFAALSQDSRFVLPFGILASLVPFAFLETGLALVFSVGTLVSLLLTFINLDSTLKSYLTFKSTALLGPLIRHLSGLLILAFCLVYFLSANKMIAQNGFQIPDSLIDTALNLSQPASNQQEPTAPQLSIPKEQLDLLKDPDLTNGLISQDEIKQAVKDQIQNFINPFIGFIPAVLALLLFFTLQSITSMINLLSYPLLWGVFAILEKSGFIKFTTEMRPVKKMVI